MKKEFKLITMKKLNKGFTLIELMVVITVIAILASIAIVSFTRVQKQARDTKRKADMRSIATALQAYYTEKTAYPVAAVGVATGSLTTPLTPTYISAIPAGPGGATGTTNADYNYVGNASAFGICVQLEAPTMAGAAGTVMWYANTQNTGGVEATNATCAAL